MSCNICLCSGTTTGSCGPCAFDGYNVEHACYKTKDTSLHYESHSSSHYDCQHPFVHDISQSDDLDSYTICDVFFTEWYDEACEYHMAGPTGTLSSGFSSSGELCVYPGGPPVPYYNNDFSTVDATTCAGDCSGGYNGGTAFTDNDFEGSCGDSTTIIHDMTCCDIGSGPQPGCCVSCSGGSTACGVFSAGAIGSHTSTTSWSASISITLS
jgi:hypothetical protein